MDPPHMVLPVQNENSGGNRKCSAKREKITYLQEFKSNKLQESWFLKYLYLISSMSKNCFKVN